MVAGWVHFATVGPPQLCGRSTFWSRPLKAWMCTCVCILLLFFEPFEDGQSCVSKSRVLPRTRLSGRRVALWLMEIGADSWQLAIINAESMLNDGCTFAWFVDDGGDATFFRLPSTPSRCQRLRGRDLARSGVHHKPSLSLLVAVAISTDATRWTRFAKLIVVLKTCSSL